MCEPAFTPLAQAYHAINAPAAQRNSPLASPQRQQQHNYLGEGASEADLVPCADAAATEQAAGDEGGDKDDEPQRKDHPRLEVLEQLLLNLDEQQPVRELPWSMLSYLN